MDPMISLVIGLVVAIGVMIYKYIRDMNKIEKMYERKTANIISQSNRQKATIETYKSTIETQKSVLAENEDTVQGLERHIAKLNKELNDTPKEIKGIDIFKPKLVHYTAKNGVEYEYIQLTMALVNGEDDTVYFKDIYLTSTQLDKILNRDVKDVHILPEEEHLNVMKDILERFGSSNTNY